MHQFFKLLTKAHTFPEPVIALPQISRPVRANGIQAAYKQSLKFNNLNYNVSKCVTVKIGVKLETWIGVGLV